MGFSLAQNKRLVKPSHNGFLFLGRKWPLVFGWHFAAGDHPFNPHPELGVFFFGHVAFLEKRREINSAFSSIRVMTRHAAASDHPGCIRELTG